ncbi:MAG: DUF1566 domain-containing protein [Nitrospirae bacterium]|nr:DUF1566 domain-containing protein [Nitrospirota bacterium]
MRLKKYLLAAAFCFIPVFATWAGTVSLPQTGQTSCWDPSGSTTNAVSCTGTGQDGDKRAGVAWPSPRFTNNGDGTVTDNLTGLVWLKNANCFGNVTWDKALTGANNLTSVGNVCGLNDGSHAGDWRVPNIEEILSLPNYQQSDVAAWLNSQGFTSVQSNYYWSSSTSANTTWAAWLVYIVDGSSIWYTALGKGYSLPLWPVRSGQAAYNNANVPQTGQTGCWNLSGQVQQCGSGTASDGTLLSAEDGALQKGTPWPATRFTNNGNGTMTDNLTGLVWLKNGNCLLCEPWNVCLTNANSLANGQCNLTDGSRAGDWRLPNIRELRSLINRGQPNFTNWLTSLGFNMQESCYWASSTTHATKPDEVWYIRDDGNINTSSKGGFCALPVRDGQVSNSVTLAISKSGTGLGTVTSSDGKINCGSTCSASYNQSIATTLTATASSGSTFVGWSGGTCSGTGTCTLNSSNGVTVTAAFTSSGASDYDNASAAIRAFYNQYPTYFGTASGGVATGTYNGGTYYVQWYTNGTGILAWTDGYIWFWSGSQLYDSWISWKTSSDLANASAAIRAFYNQYPTYFGTASGGVATGTYNGGTYYVQWYTNGTGILAWTDGYIWFWSGSQWYDTWTSWK